MQRRCAFTFGNCYVWPLECLTAELPFCLLTIFYQWCMAHRNAISCSSRLENVCMLWGVCECGLCHVFSGPPLLLLLQLLLKLLGRGREPPPCKFANNSWDVAYVRIDSATCQNGHAYSTFSPALWATTYVFSARFHQIPQLNGDHMLAKLKKKRRKIN